MRADPIKTIIYFLAMIAFLIMTYFCYIKINQRIDESEVKHTVTIFTTDSTTAEMSVKAEDMLTKKDTEVSKTTAVLNAFYNNDKNVNFDFDIVMKAYSDYDKTEGVDGENSHEYTYEVLENGVVIVKETEIPSFKEGDEIILASTTIKPSAINNRYEIIFRFYSNEFNQNHLLGKTLSSNIRAQGKEDTNN